MKPRVIPKIGDIVEIETSSGLAYVQFTEKHTTPPTFGELVRVLPGLHNTRPSDFSALAQKKESYFVFTPLRLACRRKQATIVSNQPVPEWAQGIPIMRMANGFDENGKGRDWYLWDGIETWPATGNPEDLNNLSIAAIWGHDILTERLAERWLPSDEPVENPSSVKFEQQGSYTKAEQAKEESEVLRPDSPEPQEVRHYLYFPTEIVANNATRILKAHGYSAEARRSEAQDSWLILVSSLAQLDQEQLNDAMTYLKDFAASRGGEYDGWDVLVNETS